MINKILYFFLLLALPVIVVAQPVVKSLSLKDAQEYALKNNMTIKNARVDLEIAKKKIWETTAMGLPQLNAAAAYSHIFKVPEVSFPGTILSNSRNTSTQYGLSLIHI